MSAGRIVFVTGTGTDVGKTVATAALSRAAHRRGLTVQAIKPVQTGCTTGPDGQPVGSDLDRYRDAAPEARAAVLDYYAVPSSPHYAAGLEGKRLSPQDIAARLRACQDEADLTLVEGAGGLLVPVNETETFADVLVRLPGVQVVVVVANQLGAINHALLTLESLRARGLDAAAIVANDIAPAGDDDLAVRIARDNLSVYSRMGKVPLVVPLPHYDAFTPASWDDAAARLTPVIDAVTAPARAEDDVLSVDAARVWHPYAKTHPPARVWEAVRTEGTRIVLRDGRRLIDGMSSWWSAIHGYNNPALRRALHEQVEAMPHVMFGGLTHRPAVLLADRLAGMAPEGLDRVFFADSGSVAMEVAMKMALQYQVAVGKPGKRRFLTPRGGYHGDTLGAMSVCDPVTGMHGLFAGVVPEQLFFDRPVSPFHGEFDPGTLASLEESFRDHADDIAAVVMEPIVQGAGGMWFYRPEYLRRARELCDAHGVLLVLDEIATGFGRTGRLFASEWAGVRPDIMAVGKALTGGVMTLAAVLARDDIARAIDREGVFMHGPTFMANPLACRVALASLDELDRAGWAGQVASLERGLEAGLEPLRGADGVRDVRVLGGIGVVEMEEPVAMDKLMAFFVEEAGVWLRPFGRLVYAMPPYISTTRDIQALCDGIGRAIRESQWR